MSRRCGKSRNDESIIIIFIIIIFTIITIITIFTIGSFFKILFGSLGRLFRMPLQFIILIIRILIP
jgi:hypothetical protein